MLYVKYTYIYIYIYVCVYVCVCIYIYIYIYTHMYPSAPRLRSLPSVRSGGCPALVLSVL